MRTVSVVGSGGVVVGDLAALRAERRDMGQDTQFGWFKGSWAEPVTSLGELAGRQKGTT